MMNSSLRGFNSFNHTSVNIKICVGPLNEDKGILSNISGPFLEVMGQDKERK